LVEQLKTGGRLITPLMDRGVQKLTLIKKVRGKIERTVICEVLYVSLRGRYGAEE
jgi:protein-L-isoaspartate O-methyltransferase